MTEIKSSPYRFVNLILFVLASLINSFQGSAFGSIAPIITEVYKVDEIYVNLNGMVYAFMYLIVVFPTNYILHKRGIKFGTLLGR